MQSRKSRPFSRTSLSSSFRIPFLLLSSSLFYISTLTLYRQLPRLQPRRHHPALLPIAHRGRSLPRQHSGGAADGRGKDPHRGRMHPARRDARRVLRPNLLARGAASQSPAGLDRPRREEVHGRPRAANFISGPGVYARDLPRSAGRGRCSHSRVEEHRHL